MIVTLSLVLWVLAILSWLYAPLSRKERVLLWHSKPIFNRITESGFHPGRGTVDQVCTHRRVLEGAWEFAQTVHMFLWIWRGHSTVSLGESCGGFFGIMGYRARLCRLSAPCMTGVRAWSTSATVSRTCGERWTLPGLPFVTNSVHNFNGQNF